MPDRPIIMSAPMVRAILAGRKTETRRLLKPQPPRDWEARVADQDEDQVLLMATDGTHCQMRLRWGVGDRLWVREAWAPISPDEHERPIHECDIWYRADTDAAAPGNWDEIVPGERPRYARWRPSIHMPRWASRITLAVTEVRVERLQEIDDEGAIREGCPGHYQEPETMSGWIAPYEEYAELWDSMHGEGAWNVNPWVAVIRFVPTLANIDQEPRP